MDVKVGIVVLCTFGELSSSRESIDRHKKFMGRKSSNRFERTTRNRQIWQLFAQCWQLEGNVLLRDRIEQSCFSLDVAGVA
jgi:hypothetical protein